ncbi:hypothetical protein PoB_002248100 [Plakobranchus ocellatus]|uniref:Uncharacterized protein n=1 Tax=Plakobranchus ocellatus TaxID=259542 RepID=A0AAV3Z9K0_9GAST|nr:hypothetical protein PoB_002248100 [Plakobranchus ocellatus]
MRDRRPRGSIFKARLERTLTDHKDKAEGGDSADRAITRVQHHHASKRQSRTVAPRHWLAVRYGGVGIVTCWCDTLSLHPPPFALYIPDQCGQFASFFPPNFLSTLVPIFMK